MNSGAFTYDEWVRALAMPAAEFAQFVRAQRLYRERPDMDADDPAMERVFDALAGAGLVESSVVIVGESAVKQHELTENHTVGFLAALTARAEHEGHLT